MPGGTAASAELNERSEFSSTLRSEGIGRGRPTRFDSLAWPSLPLAGLAKHGVSQVADLQRFGKG